MRSATQHAPSDQPFFMSRACRITQLRFYATKLSDGEPAFDLVQALVPGHLHGMVVSLHEAPYMLQMHYCASMPVRSCVVQIYKVLSDQIGGKQSSKNDTHDADYKAVNRHAQKLTQLLDDEEKAQSVDFTFTGWLDTVLIDIFRLDKSHLCSSNKSLNLIRFLMSTFVTGSRCPLALSLMGS